MRKVENPGILHLGGKDELRLFESDHFRRVCSDLPRPNSQTPRVVHLIGRRQKSLSLKGLLSHNNVQRSPGNYFAALRPDLSTVNQESPLLFLDSDPFPITTIGEWPNLPVIQSYPLLWLQRGSNAEHVSDVLHARLLCVFLDDFSRPDSLFKKVEQWIGLGAGSNVDRAVRPRLLIVSRSNDLPVFVARLLLGLQDAFSDIFSSVQPLFLGGENMSLSARYYRLKEAISNNSMDILNLRRRRSLSFSATHLGEFFHAATLHSSKTMSVPFDFLASAWSAAEHGQHISQHLHRFFQLCQQHHTPYTDTVFNITSALLVDAFPPGMHGRCKCAFLFVIVAKVLQSSIRCLCSVIIITMHALSLSDNVALIFANPIVRELLPCSHSLPTQC